MVNKEKFDAVFEGMKEKLTVESIMTSKEKFKSNDPYSGMEFDVVPISDGGKINQFRLKADRKIYPITNEHIISSKLDLLTLLDCFKEKEFYFVKHGKEIMGLVHISDLNKSPMRVLLYLFLAEIELSLKKFMSQRLNDPLPYIGSDERIKKVKEAIEKNQSKKLELDVYEYLYLTDYFNILKKKEDLLGELGITNKKLEDFMFINNLRNDIAHPTRLLIEESTNPLEAAQEFADRVNRMREFIGILNEFN